MPEIRIVRMDGVSPEDIVDRAGAIDEENKARGEELDGLKAMIVPLALFKPGSKTGHLDGNHFSTTVQEKESVTWDQGILAKIRAEIGDEAFLKVFKWEFSPIDKKTVDAAIAFGEHGKLIESARTIKKGKPYVSFKRMEVC
ncbi:MAG: hypothetical protein LBW85_09645 [Deltaproteobacteria bacterium]|jgi:hypothetical protein|nr:hypothetical protein [Deltaproteobacteria bacterium]